MNIRDELLDRDPIRREGPLSDAQVQMMRARTLAAAAPAGRSAPVLSTLAVVASSYCVAAAILVALVVRHGVRHGPEPPMVSVESAAPGQTISRMYFETPSGIRVVWTFDTDFSERRLP
jgi:hypothetical protein